MYFSIEIKKLRADAAVPAYATSGAAGLDLSACIDAPVTLAAGARELVPTGISVAVPEGYAAMIFARSGLAVKRGIALSNGVGVVDSDYRGEVKVGLINLSAEPYTIQSGERIAQMVIMPALQAEIKLVGELSETERGSGGFGSTGK